MRGAGDIGGGGGDGAGFDTLTRIVKQSVLRWGKKIKKAAKPHNVFFASFSDTEKETGCGEFNIFKDTKLNPHYNRIA